MLNSAKYFSKVRFLCRLAFVQAILLWQLQGRAQQIANYVANGSFEELYDCIGPPYPITKAKYWLGIDSIHPGAGYFSVCNNSVPLNSFGFQYPKTGNALSIATLYEYNTGRGYLKNRLRSTLQSGKIYCVKFYINISNNSTYGMDGFGAYFGDNSLDTITHGNIELAYLHPQVKNPIGQIITDTLHWAPITGTFAASGSEKYMVIGNFLPHNSVDTLLINPTLLPEVFTDVLIDDASCIDIDLPAYAGPDQPLIAGDSVYLGRDRDFAIDEACTWYQLPDMIHAIDTAAGLWVKPATTTTYVVKQEIYCGSTKWDTVVVFMTAVGIKNLKDLESRIIIYPNPAQDVVQIQYPGEVDHKEVISIYNKLGQLVREETIRFKNEAAFFSTADLPNGIYVLRLDKTVTKKLLISR